MEKEKEKTIKKKNQKKITKTKDKKATTTNEIKNYIQSLRIRAREEFLKKWLTIHKRLCIIMRMKMKKFALIALLIVLLFTFYAGQRPYAPAVRARADEIPEVWNMYMNNWLIVPNDTELREEAIISFYPTYTTAERIYYGNYDGETFALRLASERSDYYLDLTNARFTLKDNSFSYAFVFNFAGSTPDVEEMAITVLISEGTLFNDVPVSNFIPYDLTLLKLYGIQAYRCSRSIIEEDNELYYEFGDFVSPIPFFNKSLIVSGGYINYTKEAIYPASCLVANENNSKFFNCDYGVIMPDLHVISNSDVLRTSWENLSYESYAQFNTITPYQPVAVASAGTGNTAFYYSDTSFLLGFPYDTGLDTYSGISLSEGEIFNITYQGNVRFGQGPFATPIYTTSFNVGYYGNTNDANVRQYASISNCINICPVKISLTPGPSPQPQPGDDDSDINIAIRIYNETTAALYASIYALVAYPVVAIVNGVGWLITGDTVIEWNSVKESVNAVFDWLYSSLNNVARALGSFFSKVGSTLKTFFTETLPHFFTETLPEVVNDTVDFITTWWWALVIGGLVILAAVVAIMIINRRR